MKKIIEGKVYDTETAEKIFSFRRQYTDPIVWKPGYCFKNWEKAEYLKTKKGAYLYYCEGRKDLQITTEEKVKETIRNLDADRYMELFGEVEEG